MPERNSHSEEPAVDRRTADIAIVCSTLTEVRPLVKRLDRQRRYADGGAVFRGGFLDESLRIAVVEVGSGFANHRQVTETLIREHRPTWVLSVGFSSPLTEELQSGDICIANEICDTHGNSLPVKTSIAESPRIRVRRHVVADAHPCSATERQELAKQFSAAAVDTTSLAVAQACHASEQHQLNSRFMSVRGIVGSVDEDIPEKVVREIFMPEPPGLKKIPLPGLLKKLKPDRILQPWLEKAEQTSNHLSRFVLGVIERLGERIRLDRD